MFEAALAEDEECGVEIRGGLTLAVGDAEIEARAVAAAEEVREIGGGELESLICLAHDQPSLQRVTRSDPIELIDAWEEIFRRSDLRITCACITPRRAGLSSCLHFAVLSRQE